MRKKVILLILIFTLMFSVNVFAQSNISMTYDEWINYIDDVENDPNLVSQVLRMLGFVVSDIKFVNKLPVATLKDIMGIPSDTSIKDWFKNNSSEDENGYPELNTDLNDGLKDVENYYVTNNINYLYSYSTSELSGLFASADAYLKARDFIGNAYLSNSYYFLTSYYGINKIYTCSHQAFPYVYVQGNSNSMNLSRNFAWGTVTNGSNNVTLSYPDWESYTWNGTDKEWIKDNSANLVSVYGLINKDGTVDYETATNQRAFFFTNEGRSQIRYIAGQASVSDILYQDYYYNNDTWSDFSSSSSNYSLDNSHYNSVTYGDITEYIDSFNTENGYPPSPQNITVEIKDKNDDSGGGSGGGGSGGSGSDENEPSDIFGWLKYLGQTIGNLIKGLGEFLTEVVTGLVSAITDLLSCIGDLISSITENLPTTFMSWFSTLFDWMPDEWKTLLSASLVFMVLWGIIKLVRG